MKVDRVKALGILEEEVVEADLGESGGEWAGRIRLLAEHCAGNLTFIAMAGTAILAKATNLEADPFSLKAGAGAAGSYSARTLCQHVLAAHAPRLKIDLGVTGREPLNNQPFFAEARVTDQLPVKDNARPALRILLNLLQAVDEIKDEQQAREALRGFLKARRKGPRTSSLGEGEIQLTLDSLLDLIGRFVSEDSERGKRAQAVAAGLVDVAAGPERVLVGRIHDPDQKFPGDVGVASADTKERLERAIEVRDKPVSESDVYHFVSKCAANGVTKAGIVAVAASQQPFSLREVNVWAREDGVHFVAFFGWAPFLFEVLFWSPSTFDECIKLAYRRIFHRLVELEVSEKGTQLWRSAIEK